jgi:hypothetical protein
MKDFNYGKLLFEFVPSPFPVEAGRRCATGLFTTTPVCGDRLQMKRMPVLIAALAAAASNHAWAEPFFAQLVLQDVTFQVETPNEGSINQVTIRAETPEGALEPMLAEADGSITSVEAGDLNGDGYPEIYVYINSAGSGSYGSLVAYASNRNKSFTPIYLPPIEDDPSLAQGYMGHDEFAVGEGALLRRFPVYREGDTNARPTGGTRQIQYKLVAGEAGWVLRKDRTVD